MTRASFISNLSSYKSKCQTMATLRLFIDLTSLRFLSGDPIPLIPLPLDKGKGEVVREGLTPLLNTPLYYPQIRKG